MALITGLFEFSFTVMITGFAAAQTIDMGARGLGLANAVVAVPNLPFESANPAAGLVGQPIASFSFGQAFGLSELRYVTTIVSYPIGVTMAGLSIESFGFDAYRRLTLGIVGSTIVCRGVRWGARATVRRVAITGYGSKLATGVSFGWTASLSRGVRTGGAWRYVGAGIGHRNGLLPEELSFGFEARAGPNLRLLCATAKETGSNVDLRVGAEVAVVNQLSLRVGTGTTPDRVAFGFGLTTAPISTDAGVSLHQTLGPSFAISVSIQ